MRTDLLRCSITEVATISIEEYLRTSYRPDVEYLNGILKPKPESGFEHGETEGMLGVWFYEHRKEWNLRCGLNVRTQVSATCVRLIDLVVVGAANRGEREQLTIPPLVAIEVLSFADTYMDLKSRAGDLEKMGVQNIWLIDPELRAVAVWGNSSWEQDETAQLQAVASPIYLDLNWLWQQMDE